MNPELTKTLSMYQKACGITDMMAHVMERYFSNTENVEVTDRLCEGILKSIINETLKLKENISREYFSTGANRSVKAEIFGVKAPSRRCSRREAIERLSGSL